MKKKKKEKKKKKKTSLLRTLPHPPHAQRRARRSTLNDARLRVGSGGVPREQKMLKGHLPRVIYHEVYQYTKLKLNREPDPHVQAPWFQPAATTATPLSFSSALE